VILLGIFGCDLKREEANSFYALPKAPSKTQAVTFRIAQNDAIFIY
jgi:hypothetical protein